MAPPATANIRVLVRVRPLNNSERTECGSIGRTNVLKLDDRSTGTIDFNEENKENGATISINNYNDASRRVTNTEFRAGYASDGEMIGGNSKQYMFDAVHGERSTQCEVYESAKGIVDAVVDGYNGTIVAYGQTGSGKTHTVFGSGVRGDDEGAGLIQRSLRDLFSKITISQAEAATAGFDEGGDMPPVTSKTTFKGSFFEIFNERVYDLLSSDNLEKTLAVREDSNGVYVEGLKEIEVGNTVEAENLFARGLENRHVASTNMNRTSSRSHAVFFLSVKTEHTTSDGIRKVRNSKFTLVDLAGSERQKSTATAGNRLKEASMINKSLLCLGHVINALVDKEHGKARHVPFRNSKLTFLLKDTWGGNSKTCLVATVSPSGASQGETLSTLTFAQRAKLIKNNAVLNENTCGTVAALQAEVAKLKSKLEQSSSTITSKPFEGLTDSKSKEVMVALKRRNQRAQSRIAELERQIADESDITSTLKRKLQEEAMVRKFKERRLDSLQRKNIAVNENDQINELKNEIVALRRRLDGPSEDAIEWRVSYEETKEALEKKLEEGQGDASELEEKNSKLEDTVDRLCTEKLDLEGKIVELTQSSNETRMEIESIMKEVDNLEKEMVSCQEELQRRNDQCRDSNNRANDAESKLQDLMNNVDVVNEEKLRLEEESKQLQSSVQTYSQKILDMTEALEKKNSDLLELESLVDENEKQLKYVIEDLKKDFEKATNILAEKNSLVSDLEARLSSASEESFNLSAKIKDALSENEKQKKTITEMERKIVQMAQEKEDALESAKRESNCVEAEMVGKVDSLQGKLVELASEKEHLESRLSCVKQQMDLSAGNVDERQATIQGLDAQISTISEEHASIERELRAGINILEKDLCETRERINALSAKIAEVKDERNATVNSLEEEKVMMAENLSNEIEGLKNSLDQDVHEKQALQTKLESFQNNELELQSTIQILSASLTNLEAELGALQDERNREIDAEDNQKKLQNRFRDLATERDELLEEVVIMNEELRTVAEENFDLAACARDAERQVALLKVDVEKKTENWQKKINKAKGKKEHALIALDSAKTRQNELEIMMEGKESEIKKLSRNFATQQEALNDTQSALQDALKDQKTLRLSCDQLSNVHASEIESLKRTQSRLESDVARYQDQIASLADDKARSSKELVELRESALKFNEATDASSQLSDVKYKLDALVKEHKIQFDEKDNELGVLEVKLKSVESDCSSLRKQNKDVASSEVEIRDKYNLSKDRYTLLEREKGNLEFELDTMQADQDALGDQVRVYKDENADIKAENERLKSQIEDLKNSDNCSNRSQEYSPSGSTWHSDSRLSYDTLATNMNSMIEKMTSANAEPPTCTEPIEEENEDEAGDLDDSFDEDLFLPNNENRVAMVVPPVLEPVLEEQALNISSMEAVQNEVPILNECNKENEVSKPSVSFCSPQGKGKGDYGTRRVPLSDRKNRTPVQSKRPHSSAKQIMSGSSKKARSTPYMFIDNKTLFN